MKRYVKNGSQESNSRSIRLSFCLQDKGLPASPGSSTKPSIDLPLLPRPLKTASGERLNTRSSYDKHRALPPDGTDGARLSEDITRLLRFGE